MITLINSDNVLSSHHTITNGMHLSEQEHNIHLAKHTGYFRVLNREAPDNFCFSFVLNMQ